MKQKFKPFDARGYAPPKFLAGFLKNCFDKPKEFPMWDARKQDQRELLQSLANDIKQFLRQLPDGEEIGATMLAECLAPELWGDEHFVKFIIKRIERVRYADMLDGYFYTIPDDRWKAPRTFYKYHNGKGANNDLASLR